MKVRQRVQAPSKYKCLCRRRCQNDAMEAEVCYIHSVAVQCCVCVCVCVCVLCVHVYDKLHIIFIIQVTVRVWSRKEAYNQTAFALQVAIDVLSFYEEFFDIAYPLPKQGIVLCHMLMYGLHIPCGGNLW